MSEDTGYYLVVTADATEEQARAAFVRRYNTNPEKVIHLYGSNREWWVGPAEVFPPLAELVDLDE